MAITSLVKALPEVYQPIYGHPEFNDLASRPCEDRLRLVTSIYARLAGEIGRPLRVLDLGCAQGYFSLHLAEQGATVKGIDRLEENIKLCRGLAEENPGYSVQFEVGSIEEVLSRLMPGDIDLVIGMSVMHHLCAERGAEQTRAILKELSSKIEAGIFEVALKEEPLPWAPQQPDTPDWLYQDFAFLACTGEFPTHLSDTVRPIYFTSNKFWLAGGAITRFQHWTPFAHELDPLAIDRQRRYFNTDNQFMKLFRFHGPQAALNRQELEREIECLGRPDAATLGLPKLSSHFLGQHEGWVVRERVPGTLLSTCILNGEKLDRTAIVGSLLQQLAILEGAGLFHEDLRAWNILVRPDGGATLIDYGSICGECRDRDYPRDWRIPLLILLNQLFRSRDALSWPPKLTDLHPTKLPMPASSLAWKLWNAPPQEWSWEQVSREWSNHSNADPLPPAVSLRENLQIGIDEEMQQRIAALKTEIDAIQNRLHQWGRYVALLRPLFGMARALLPAKILPSPLRKAFDDRPQRVTCHVCQYGVCRPYSGPHWVGDPSYALLQCDACKAIFSNPLPSNEQLSALYQTSFDYRWYQDHYAAKLNDCRARVKEYAPLLGKRVLDFGGGVGYFSQAVREAGLDSVTYDPYVTTAPPQKRAWDCVVALHVLEHSNDLERTLSEIKDFLVPGGKVVFAVPNFESSGYRDQGMRWVWAQPPLIHIFHFTAAGLTALLARHGFDNIQISYHERWDANHHADVLHAEHFRRWDAAWGLRGFRSIPGYRKLVAAINSRRRYRALEKSMDTPMKDRAELQVSAALAIK
jgi:2-polyprenyl-3-methyl-5-hydroxy-6-metoxy-1,4-benzoquinol methylase